MGLSGGSTKSTYTPSPQQTLAASTLAGVYNANAGNTQNITNTLSGMVPGLASTAGAANSAAGSSAGYYSDVLGGKYLSQGNPYLAGQIAASDNSIRDQVNSSFSAAGRTGSGANTYSLAKALGENENNLRYGDYNTEMGRMDSAAQGAAGLQSSSLGSLTGLGTTAAGLPLSQAATYASGIGNLRIDGSTTKTDTPSTMDQIMKGIQLGSTLFSDRRLKRGITLLSRMADGLGLYRYRYLWSDDEHIGVMADEVARLRPHALGPIIGGFATVNYGRL